MNEEISRRKFIPYLAAGVGGLMITCSEGKTGFREPQSPKGKNKAVEPVETAEQKNGSNELPIILPSALKKGDKVAIIAPAGPIRELRQADDFEKLLNDLGFEVVTGKNVRSKYGYFSATDQERKEELEGFFKDETVKAIVGIKGGWGCARLLPILDYDVIKANPKIVMGFSDITTLLNGITLKTGLITFHGPVGTATWLDYTMDYVKRVLMKGELVNFKSTTDYKTLTGGEAEGILMGGNLSVLCALIGTPYFPDSTGKLLFIEDVEEEPFRMDRMLTHLKLAGVFDKINGLIIGKCRKCDAEEPDFAFTMDEIYTQHFTDFGKPVYQGANIGHIRDKFTVPIGIRAKMNADTCSFEMLEPGVKL